MGICFKSIYQLLFGIFKEKSYPLCIRILLGCYLVGLFLVALPQLLPIMYALFLAGLCIVAVIVAGGLLFVFPIFTVFSSIIDILIGGMLKDYKQNNKLKYHLPALTYCLPALLIILMGTYLESKIALFNYRSDDYLAFYHTIILYMGISAVYVIVFYLGMQRRICHIDGGRYYIKVLNKHNKFLKLSIIPISFLVTLLTIMTAFGDINISLIMIMEFIYIVISDLNGNSLQSVFIFVGILYVFSIPVQLVALLVNPIFKYIFEEGKHYKEMAKRSIVTIYNIIK